MDKAVMNRTQRAVLAGFEKHKAMGASQVRKLSGDLKIPAHRVSTILRGFAEQGLVEYGEGVWSLKKEKEE